MNSHQPRNDDGCPQPQLSELLTDYCFGVTSETDREAVQQHLLECDICWAAVRRLYDAVETLRRDPQLPPVPITAETIGAMSMSGQLELPFAGHRAFALTIAALYGLLYTTSVRTVRKSGVGQDDFSDGQRGEVIIRVKEVLALVGIDEVNYERLAPKPLTSDDPLWRELQGIFGKASGRAAKKRARSRS